MSQVAIVTQEINGLLDSWIEAERNGVEFPVPFEAAWRMAEYSTKANAKQSGLKALKKGKQFSSEIMKTPGGGRSSELINLSVDGFKHFCLMADTEAGEAVRQYFIDAEKKWKLTQQIAPAVAEEVEILHLKLEIAKQEAIGKIAEEKTIGLRHYVVTALPKPVADRILGVSSVVEVEYRDRIIKDNQVVNDGSTINKTALCQRYGIITKNGKPDYKRLNLQLDAIDIPNRAWEETDVVQTNRELKRDYLPELDRALYTAEQRQIFLGE